MRTRSPPFVTVSMKQGNDNRGLCNFLIIQSYKHFGAFSTIIVMEDTRGGDYDEAREEIAVGEADEDDDANIDDEETDQGDKTGEYARFHV
jgi:hypothetical protein